MSNITATQKFILTPAQKSQSILAFQKSAYKDILEICKPLFDHFGISLFSQTRAFHNGYFTSLMTATELTEHYINCKYPIYFSQGKGITLEAGTYIAAFMENPKQQEIRQELKALFNVDHMVHIIDKQSTYDDMYSFATTPENYTFVNQLINNMDIVKHFILYYKDKSASLIKKATLVRYENDYFLSNNAIGSSFDKASSQPYQNLLSQMAIKKVHIPTPFGEIRLSKREFDCLKYLAKSHTLKEIAKFLDISPRTVETYVNNIKYKLKCDTKAQLMVILNQLNIF